jgi:hypothetical protein
MSQSKYSVYDATPDQWSLILNLAQKWEFKEVELLCIRELEKLDLSPVDRIHIYQTFGLDSTLLIDSYATLTSRDEPIGLDEGMKLGLMTSLKIARAREMSRRPDTISKMSNLFRVFHRFSRYFRFSSFGNCKNQKPQNQSK